MLMGSGFSNQRHVTDQYDGMVVLLVAFGKLIGNAAKSVLRFDPLSRANDTNDIRHNVPGQALLTALLAER